MKTEIKNEVYNTYSTFADMAVDAMFDGYGFECKETLKGIVEEIKSKPGRVVDAIEMVISRLSDRLLDDGICPKCGGRLEQVSQRYYECRDCSEQYDV